MTSRHRMPKYIVMDEATFWREYKKAFDETQAKATMSDDELEAEFDRFDRLLTEALEKKWASCPGGQVHFEISDEWQHTLHHCGGIYSKQIYCAEYIDILLDVLSQLPHSTLWTYHTACECPELWNGGFFVRYPTVYFPKDGKDYVGSFVPHDAQVEHVIGSDPMIQVREAAIDGDSVALHHILASDPGLVNSKDAAGDTPLHHAAKKGHLSIVRLLLESGSALDAKNDNGETPLFSACRGTNPHATLQLLLDGGAKVNVVSDCGDTPLTSASLRGDGEAVTVLLDAGATIEHPSDDEGPLHYTAFGDHADVAGLLIDRGADPNKKAGNGFTPLHRAACQGAAGVAALLVVRGVEISARDDQGRTPLDYCAYHADRTVADLLRKHGGETSDG